MRSDQTVLIRRVPTFPCRTARCKNLNSPNHQTIWFCSILWPHRAQRCVGGAWHHYIALMFQLHCRPPAGWERSKHFSAGTLLNFIKNLTRTFLSFIRPVSSAKLTVLWSHTCFYSHQSNQVKIKLQFTDCCFSFRRNINNELLLVEMRRKHL